ncbi:MAG TPA: hypothetical protein EYP34_13760 [Chromatiaceae bacterium]|nr:hypothetical protein [Chromatiaceae bacterium]
MQVGQADSAFRSQGHYRLYFGLGRYAKADTVRILQADRLRVIRSVKGNRILKVSSPQ